MNSVAGTANGNRKKVRTPLGEWRWTYDALNRMTGRDEPPIGIEDPNYPPLVTAWYYDHNGNVERLIGPDGGLTDYEYDARNRMTKVTRKDTESDPDPRITTYSYYENNLLKLKTLPNGCEAYHEYDELDRLTLLVNRKSDQTVISSFAIEYRNDDNKSKITREDGTVIEYDYDDQKRLTKEKWTAADNTVLHDFEYSYDAVGNRLTKVYNGVTTDYDYNDLNQLIQESTGGQVTTYSYDREGNTIRKTEPAKETLYSWNPENMLTKAQFSDSTPTNEFSYDMDSVRVEKADSGGRKQYHFDGLHVLVIREGEVVDTAIVHGAAAAYGVGSQLLREGATGEHTYHQDHQGSAVHLTDQAEAIVKTTEREAFGVALEGSGTLVDPFDYLGRQSDKDIEAIAMGFRVYSPSCGLLLSRDPRAEIARVLGTIAPIPVIRHAYLYATGNPLRFVDPFGLQKGQYEFGAATATGDHALDVYLARNRRFVGKAAFSGGGQWVWADLDPKFARQFQRGTQVTGEVLEDLVTDVKTGRGEAYKHLFNMIRQGAQEVGERTFRPSPAQVEEFMRTGRMVIRATGKSREELVFVVGRVARIAKAAELARVVGRGGRLLQASAYMARVGGKWLKFLVPVSLVLVFASEADASNGDLVLAAKKTAVRTGKDLVLWDEFKWLVTTAGRLQRLTEKQFDEWVARQTGRYSDWMSKKAGFNIWTPEIEGP